MAHELPHELPNNLRLRIFGNYKILEKCQMWVETQPNTQSPFQTPPNADNSRQKTRTIRYYTPEAPPNPIVSPYPAPNTPLRIVDYCLCESHKFQNLWRHHRHCAIMEITLMPIPLESYVPSKWTCFWPNFEDWKLVPGPYMILLKWKYNEICSL